MAARYGGSGIAERVVVDDSELAAKGSVEHVINASWQGVFQCQDVDQLLVFFFSGDGEGHECLVDAAMVVRSSLFYCTLLVFCYLYLSQLCIRTIIASNVRLRSRNVEKK